MSKSTLESEIVSLPPVIAPRLEGVDVLRGLIMVVMALDHTRDYFFNTLFDPTDLSRTTPALFLTRWITHYCAPTFALLAGVGARLAGGRRDSKALAYFLLTRGLWLIFLEATVVKFGLLFRPSPGLWLGLVLWSLGGSFVLLSAFAAMRVSPRAIGITGAVIVVGHNVLDLLPPFVAGSLGPFLFLLRPGVVSAPGGITVFMGYPLLPWFGVVALGYWLGGLYGLEPGLRRKSLAWLGLAAIALFVVSRAFQLYGEPRPWSRGEDVATSILSFVNCTKYPPSLQFLLMTLGPAMLALAAFDRGAGALGKPLATLGRVPLFYYVLQWYVIHGLALVVAIVRGEPIGWLFVDQFPLQPPPSFTFGLAAVYGWWVLVVAILYVPCAWFASYKRKHRDKTWLSYL